MAKFKIRTASEREEPPARQNKAPEESTGYSSEFYKQVRAQLAIDKNDLNTCVERQPVIYQEVGEKVSFLLSQRDAKKEELARAEAEIAGEVREAAANRKETKTVGEVRDAVLLNRSRMKLADELARLELEVSLWTNLKFSFDQRGKMLREEVALFTSGYFQASSLGGTRAAQRDASATANRAALAMRRQRVE